MKLTDHFDSDEFTDPDTGECKMDPMFMAKLEGARTLAGIPFIITSGYRSPAHNAAVGGKPDSAHLEGRAADIACSDSITRFKIIEAAYLAGFRRIEIAANHIHLDFSLTLPQNVLVYSNKP